MFKRVGLFVALNLAVVVMISIVFTVFGLDHRAGLGQNLQLGPVLVSSMIIGFVGAFVSLLLSKPMAKWSVGAKPLEPTHWVYQTVATQAERAGIPHRKCACTHRMNPTRLPREHSRILRWWRCPRGC